MEPRGWTTRKPYCHAELDSASIQHCVLSVTLARFRNKFGMTVKNISSLRADECRRGNPPAVEPVPSWLVVKKSCSTSHGRASGTWITTSPSAPRDDRGVLARAGFTMAARLSRSTESRAIKGLWACGQRIAFTMAEILLSLTIIGVVAAITLPSLTGNINERTWNTQRKALYARFSQAIALMPALNGYGTLTEGDSSTSAEDTAAETFVTAGLAKVLKINNICDSEHLEDCGIADNIVTLKGNTLSNFTTSYNTLVDFNSMFAGSYSTSGVTYTYSQLNTKAAAFETQNGESIVVYYNPNCVGDMGETERYFIQPKMCANFVYDLNASKGPNTVGKDIGFLTVMYPSDSVVVAPVPLVSAYGYNLKYEEASQKCRALDSESRLPNREEIVAMFVNRNLLYGTERTGTYWTTSSFVSNSGILMWGLNFNIGHLFPCGKNATSNYYWCIKR